jgi:ferric-dicitrate binding protein FerR (iron transport regulator)
MGDLDEEPDQCHELEVHLLLCAACTAEYEDSEAVIEFIQEHKSLFAEAFAAVEKERAAEQEQIERSCKCMEAKLDKVKAQEERARFLRTLWKVSAIAACLAVGIVVWLRLSNPKAVEKLAPREVAVDLASSIKIEPLSDNGDIIIPPGREVKTAANGLKTLTIAGKHRLVMNSNTDLMIERLVEGAQLGCLVRLRSGEVLAHIEHDGNPFVVVTAHGNAVITGTVFDIKAGKGSTTLVVAEGSVWFKSNQGCVEVTAGRTSTIVAQSAPTTPKLCNTTDLTSWATGHKTGTALGKIRSNMDDYDLPPLSVSAVSGPVDLEDIDCEQWVEENVDWFKRAFPWILQLKDALAEEGIEVDYPELLVRSGDLWQFSYPEHPHGRIPVLDGDRLVETAARYGFSKQWLLKNVAVAKAAIEHPVQAKNRSTGVEAFEKWADHLVAAQKTSAELGAGMAFCSLYAGKYLANTRTLAWLCAQKGTLNCQSEDQSGLLFLLQEELSAIHNVLQDAFQLMVETEKPCSTECTDLVNQMKKNIKTIGVFERKLVQRRDSR